MTVVKNNVTQRSQTQVVECKQNALWNSRNVAIVGGGLALTLVVCCVVRDLGLIISACNSAAKEGRLVPWLRCLSYTSGFWKDIIVQKVSQGFFASFFLHS